MEKQRITHPAYGQISFSRIHGTSNFYGSELTQDTYIEIKVNHSELERDLVNERFCTSYSQSPILIARMSCIQFSELITSLNMGEGVPCTLEVVDGKQIEKLDKIESRKEFVHNKFKERMTEFSKSIKNSQKEAIEIVTKKTLSKDDVMKLKNNLDFLTTEITNNIPFFMECFQETMDEVVLESKMEIENAIMHKINTLGLTALKNENDLKELK